MHITIVAGARPNFVKIAPIIKAIQIRQKGFYNIRFRLVHTGQHYDKKMSENFFEELCIPEPNVNFGAGGGSQAEQTALIMTCFERELIQNRPDVVLVVGDVTSTMACAITAKKMLVEVVHVEAGIRSGDMAMPEEINRMVTDAICDHYFTTSQIANDNLRNAGISGDRIHFVGNTMIDTLFLNMHNLRQPSFWNQFGLTQKQYFLITLHRPSNVDNHENLTHILDVIIKETQEYPIVFSVHPRTRKNLDTKFTAISKLILVDPLGYLEFIYMIQNARAVITDSGGITEETTVLGIPCLTLRDSTERPETVTIGSNELVGINPNNLKPYLTRIKNDQWKKSSVPPLWDGKAAERIVEILTSLYSAKSS